MAALQSPAKEPTKHAGGRPLAYATVADLEQAVNSYFSECDPHLARRMTETGQSADGSTMFGLREVMTEQKPYTMSGLARHMGIDRGTLLNYSKIQQFFSTVQAARERVHEFAESQLYSRNASGAQFSLKNNFDWKDRSEIDHTTKDGPIPLLAGLASPGALTIEDEADDGTAEADHSADKDQQP